jgi:UbiD family decarboxylase
MLRATLAYQDLREWISALEKAGELKRIKAEADPILEIAEITDRVSKWGPRGSHGPGGPALLFENVKGHPGAKVLINQFGSERRMTMALDVDSLDEIADRIKMFMDVKSPQGLLDKIKMLPMLAEMGKFFPKEVSTGPVQGSHQARPIFAARLSHSAMLAAGRRPLHHSAVGHHQRSADRQAQRGNVSPTGL